jgi:predicted alpha/beta-fold hydrolase
VPATILTSADDPVIPVADFHALKLAPGIELDIAERGGHCGFIRDLALRSFVEDYIAERMLARAAPRPAEAKPSAASAAA